MQTKYQGGVIATHYDPTTPDVPKALTYYLTVYGTDFVSITDDAGHTNTRIDDTFALPVPNVTYNLIGERSVMLSMPTEKTYTVTFRTGLYPIALEMLKGIDNVTPTQMIRYVDLSMPRERYCDAQDHAAGS